MQKLRKSCNIHLIGPLTANGRLPSPGVWNPPANSLADPAALLHPEDAAADAADPTNARMLRSRTPSANNALAPVRPPSGNLALQCLTPQQREAVAAARAEQQQQHQQQHQQQQSPQQQQQQQLSQRGQLRDAWGAPSAPRTRSGKQQHKQRINSANNNNNNNVNNNDNGKDNKNASPSNVYNHRIEGDPTATHLPELTARGGGGGGGVGGGAGGGVGGGVGGGGGGVQETSKTKLGKGNSEEPESGIADVGQ